MENRKNCCKALVLQQFFCARLRSIRFFSSRIMRKDGSSPNRPAGAVHETVDEPQHFRAIARQGDSWGARRAVKGKTDVVIRTVVDAVTKEFRPFFSVSSGTVQNDADLVIVFLVVQQKVIYGGVMLGQNTGTHRRVTDKASTCSGVKCQSPSIFSP